eukprot:TRINITY_DN29366_c0_g2_i1.p1 TRINITY_DN29366_c0_g2~~TRINITY_DN29366_c0_g2_i1.p1  ORF type:complete len:897 (-),score=75.17 TRINITY_DN29366_c0_g2_i1:121-2811(-)
MSVLSMTHFSPWITLVVVLFSEPTSAYEKSVFVHGACRGRTCDSTRHFQSHTNRAHQGPLALSLHRSFLQFAPPYRFQNSSCVGDAAAALVFVGAALLSRTRSRQQRFAHLTSLHRRTRNAGFKVRIARCGHDEAHSHESSHEHGMDVGHDHDEHHDSHDQHAHSHDGFGHGHSHGEVPDWVPCADKLRPVVERARSELVLFGLTGFFLFSLLPWEWTILRSVGSFTVYSVLGFPAILEALGSLGKLDVHFLMTVAAFASAAIGHAKEGASLLLLFAISQSVEDRLSLKARASLDALSQMSPETARKMPHGSTNLGNIGDGAMVSAMDLACGDMILVRAGEVVPVDGEILDGVSQIGLEHLTGEPLPLAVSKGDEVMSGALSVDGALLLRVVRPAHESTVQKIGRLTASASASRPGIVTLLDAVAERWSYAVVVSTAAVAVIPPLMWQAPLSPSLYRALVWLITASPCALILATPLVYVSGLSVAAANGVLLKGGRTLDALAASNGLAFDKTGTLTVGAPSLVRIEDLAISDSETAADSRQLALLVASALGRLSVHPVAKALAETTVDSSNAVVVDDFEMIAGAGVTGSVQLQNGDVFKAALGRPAFVAEQMERHSRSAQLSAALRSASTLESVDDVPACVLTTLALCPMMGSASDNNHCFAWVFYLEDRIKRASPDVLAEVSKSVPLYMLTGDCQVNALSTARQLGSDVVFDGIYADLRPDEKLKHVLELDAQLKNVAREKVSLHAWFLRALGVSAGGLVMVGDGVNDAPALAAATAGISIASGTEGALSTSAVEGSDVLILRQARDPHGDEDLLRVLWIMDVARRARQLVQQNIFLAMVSICGASSLTLFADIPLWLGVLLHEGTTVLVALNSLRLFSQLRGLRKQGGERRSTY